jgi:hypothetical protein
MGLSYNDLFASDNHTQGDATPDGAGDGPKGSQIVDYLSRITGAYQSIIGGGGQGTAAPAPKVQTDKPRTMPWALIGGGVAVLLVLGFFLHRRK